MRALRRRVAVVDSAAGLISNLRVLENVLLPAEYHGQGGKGTEERAFATLEKVGYCGSPMEIPGHLSLFQKRQAALARAMLMEPELLVYQGMFTDLAEKEQRILLAVALDFHREQAGRTSPLSPLRPLLPQRRTF